MTATASLRAQFGTRYSDEPERLCRYEIPERGTPGKALALLLPESEAELGEMLRLCNALAQPLVISAGRTGLVEAQRPQGEMVLSLEKLNRPLEFELADGRSFSFAKARDADRDPDWGRNELGQWGAALAPDARSGATITVEAGLSIDALNDLIEPLGLVWPMEMGSSSAATVGACIANASAGANAVCYGTAAHLCDCAWGFWGNGDSAGPCEGPIWIRPDEQTLAIDSARIDVQRGLIGTQGALGIITRARLRLSPIPAQQEAVLLPVEDMPAAMHVFLAACEKFPGDIQEFEFIGAPAFELVREHLGAAFRWPFESELSAPYFLLLQLKSASSDDDLAGRLLEFLADDLGWPSERIGYAPLPALKKLRHSITESSNARMRKLGGGRLSFDTAAPVAVFGDYLAELQRALAADWPQLQFVAFGHAGVGGAHLHLLGSREHPVTEAAAAVVARVFDVTARFGGTFSAEHGVGAKWAQEFQRRAPVAVLEALRAAKLARDPKGILNPASFGFKL